MAMRMRSIPYAVAYEMCVAESMAIATSTATGNWRAEGNRKAMFVKLMRGICWGSDTWVFVNV